MLVVGLVVALGSIAAAFVLVAVKRLEPKYLAGLMLVGAICGFIVANLTSIKDLSVKIAGIAEINASVKTLQTQVAAQSEQLKATQDNLATAARLATENQFVLSQVATASPMAARLNPELMQSVNRLAEIAVPESAARQRWLAELRAKYR